MLISLSKSRLFAQAAQERTSAHTHAEALSAGEASLFAVEPRAYFLRRCVSRYSGLLVLITMSYLSTLLPHLQVRAAIFREIGVFACLLGRGMINWMQRFTERRVHSMGWSGCVFFKKGQI